MSPWASESELVQRVARFMTRDGGDLFREVAVLGQSADLVLHRNDLLTFIEVKINAIRRAVTQCRAHELVADFVCIAIGTKSISCKNLDLIDNLGYGLISCPGPDRECSWVLMPRRQQGNWGPAKRTVYQRMIEGGVWQSNTG